MACVGGCAIVEGADIPEVLVFFAAVASIVPVVAQSVPFGVFASQQSVCLEMSPISTLAIPVHKGLTGGIETKYQLKCHSFGTKSKKRNNDFLLTTHIKAHTKP